MTNSYVFSSESVSEGHPDKIADRISDAVLDAVLEQDKTARVACETLVKTGMVLVSGEMRTSAWVNIEQLVREELAEIGYNATELGFDCNSCSVLSAIGEQSKDIAQGVDGDGDDILSIGAGDQGIMFGYACDETDSYMPAPIAYAHQLMQKQAKLRKEGHIPWLRPDAKSQITLRYASNGSILGVDTVVLSTQHDPDIGLKDIEECVREEIIKTTLPPEWLNKNTSYLINPTGKFIIGGPVGDCGITGRKIIVDTYGGSARHGGGAFSGKDPTKVDRTGGYAARYVAKNIVAAGLAKRCEIQVAYAIGVVDPVSLFVNTYGTGSISDSEIQKRIAQCFDFRPGAIIQYFDLMRPIYKQTSSYGHFGREIFPWEKTDSLANKLLNT